MCKMLYPNTANCFRYTEGIYLMHLKGQRHEKSMVFLSYAALGLSKGGVLFFFLQSSVKELRFLKAASRMPILHASLSVRIKLFTFLHFKIPQPPSRHRFGTRHAQSLHCRSLGLNLKCIKSRVGKVAPSFGVPDMSLFRTKSRSKMRNGILYS